MASGRRDQQRRRQRNGQRPSILSTLLVVGAALVSRAAAAATAAGTEPGTTTPRQLNAYGWVDRRSFADPNGWPGRATGKLEFPTREYCTATLVGPALILTAKHCFADLNGQMVPSRMDGRFLLGYSHGKALAVANIVHVWYGQEETSDWAIVKIDRNLGFEYGHLVPSAIDIVASLPYEKAFSMTAYSRDKYEYQAGNDPVCSLFTYVEASRLLVTSCSGEAGASGAAIIDANSMIYGVFVAAIDHEDMPEVHVLGDFDHRYPNFAVPVSEFWGPWKWLIENQGVYP